MQELIIKIDWVYFLGIMGALIGFAWYSGSRFGVLETDMKWVKDRLNDIKINTENQLIGAFARQSPVSLTDIGKRTLDESGLKKWIDDNKDNLLSFCDEKKTTNPYEVQEHIFKQFDTLKFDDTFGDKLKQFAFDKGFSMSILRRVGAIHFRDVCLENFKMKVEDIDKHRYGGSSPLLGTIHRSIEK